MRSVTEQPFYGKCEVSDTCSEGVSRPTVHEGVLGKLPDGKYVILGIIDVLDERGFLLRQREHQHVVEVGEPLEVEFDQARDGWLAGVVDKEHDWFVGFALTKRGTCRITIPLAALVADHVRVRQVRP